MAQAPGEVGRPTPGGPMAYKYTARELIEGTDLVQALGMPPEADNLLNGDKHGPGNSTSESNQEGPPPEE